MTSPGKSSLKCADITTEWGMLIEYRVKIKVKYLAAFLYLNEKPKPAISEKIQFHTTSGLTLNGTLCDYEIICEEKKFSCHKSVLASNSSVFKVMFTSEVR